MATNLPPQTCPKCHQDLADQPPLEKHYDQECPKPDDVTVCFKCGEILIYDEQLTLQPITPEQIEDYKANDGRWKKLLQAQKAARTLQHGHKQ